MLNSEFRQDQYLYGFNLYATTYSYLSSFLYSKMIGNNATNCTTSKILYNTTNYTIPYSITLNNTNGSNTMNLTNSFSQDYYKNLTSCNSYFNGTNTTFTNTTTIYVTNGFINIQVKKNFILFIFTF